MKVICDRAVLMDAVNLVSGVVQARSPRPQLTCVRLTAEKGKTGSLTLAATDAEVSLRLTIANVDVSRAGESLTPAEKLRQIIAAEDREQTLTLEATDETLKITGGDARFRVHGRPVKEFPAIPEKAATGKGVFQVDAATLGSLIARTIFATAKENSRYAINGVLLKCDGKTIQMVATDGRRLALAKTSAGGGAAGVEAIGIVPTKALNLVSRLVADPEEMVQVSLSENQAVFAFLAEGGAARAALSSVLVEGAFPPFEDVVPRDHDRKATFDREALASGVRRAALLTNEESRGVRMAFSGGKGEGKLQLSSRAPEMGEAEVDVEVESFEGDPIEIGFNPQYLTDALRVIEDSSVSIELKAPNKPGVIKSGSDFLYVVMPVSLS